MRRLREALPHLSMKQVRAAMAYYAEHTDEIEDILRRRREFCERLPLAPTRDRDLGAPSRRYGIMPL
jgi:hypothetical protein